MGDEVTGNTLFGNPTHEELSKAAYRCWEERGCPHGSPEIDWQRAEEELRTLERAG
jgi:hypothetical protein